jgi:hypothetical protein
VGRSNMRVRSVTRFGLRHAGYADADVLDALAKEVAMGKPRYRQTKRCHGCRKRVSVGHCMSCGLPTCAKCNTGGGAYILCRTCTRKANGGSENGKL